MNERETKEQAVIVSMGRRANQVETGMSCKAFQAVQRSSMAPQWPLSVCAALKAKKASAKLMIPTRLTATVPTARHPLGILSHATAAQRASALHMLIE